MILSWEVRRSGFFSSLNSEERKGLKGSSGHWALGTARENMFFKFKFCVMRGNGVVTLYTV